MSLSNYLNVLPVIGDRVYLHPSCQVIGDVKIGDDCSIWCNTVLRGDVNRIVIGRGTRLVQRAHPHPNLPPKRRKELISTNYTAVSK